MTRAISTISFDSLVNSDDDIYSGNDAASSRVENFTTSSTETIVTSVESGETRDIINERYRNIDALDRNCESIGLNESLDSDDAFDTSRLDRSVSSTFSTCLSSRDDDESISSSLDEFAFDDDTQDETSYCESDDANDDNQRSSPLWCFDQSRS